MTTAADPFTSRVTDVLERNQASVTTEQFLALLADVAESTSTLSAGEAEFLTEHGGFATDVVSPQAQATAQLRIAASVAAADASAVEDTISTAQLAELMGIDPANVRRMVANRDLYVVDRGRARSHRFPSWQIHNNRPLPHLREVLSHLPATAHPLDVAAFMLTPREPLKDRSPQVWLGSGGDPALVLELADEFDIA